MSAGRPDIHFVSRAPFSGEFQFESQLYHICLGCSTSSPSEHAAVRVTRWCSWLRLHYKWVRFPMASLEFLIYLILPATLQHGSRLNLQWKSVPAISFEGESGRCVGMTTLPPWCAEILGVLTSWIPKGLFRPVCGLLLPSGLQKIRSKLYVPYVCNS
jgi:hypothetical protein